MQIGSLHGWVGFGCTRITVCSHARIKKVFDQRLGPARGFDGGWAVAFAKSAVLGSMISVCRFSISGRRLQL